MRSGRYVAMFAARIAVSRHVGRSLLAGVKGVTVAPRRCDVGRGGAGIRGGRAAFDRGVIGQLRAQSNIGE